MQSLLHQQRLLFLAASARICPHMVHVLMCAGGVSADEQSEHSGTSGERPERDAHLTHTHTPRTAGEWCVLCRMWVWSPSRSRSLVSSLMARLVSGVRSRPSSLAPTAERATAGAAECEELVNLALSFGLRLSTSSLVVR